MSRRPSVTMEIRGLLPVVLFGLVLTYYVGLIWAQTGRSRSIDFVQFFTSAQAVVEGRSLYAPMLMSDIGMVPPPGRDPLEPLHPNLNPPLLAVAIAPMSTLGISVSYAGWAALSLVCGLTACLLIAREWNAADATGAHVIWFWLLFLAYYPTHVALAIGQVTFVLLLVLVGAWRAARSSRDRTAGILLGLALNLKLFAGLLIVYLAWQRRWRAVAWAAAAAAAFALATVPIVGYESYIEYVSLLPAVDWFSANWNASYASVITRVFGGSENKPLLNVPAVANGLVMLSSAGTLWMLGWLTRPAGESCRRPIFDLGFALTLIVMLLVSPLGWMYYFPLLAMPGYLVWVMTRERRLRSLRWSLAAGWGLSTVPVVLVRAADANNPANWLTFDSLYFYALIVMMCVTGRALSAGRSGVGIGLAGRH